MRKVKTYDFREFAGEGRKSTQVERFSPNDYRLLGIGTAVTAVMIPKSAYAATGAMALGDLWNVVIGIVDWIAAGVFAFAGITWMFGRQTKGIELIICGTVGYLLARHAMDIRDFLKTI